MNGNELLYRVSRKVSGQIHHYTSYESLVAILKNKSFRLTRLDLLNDKSEERLASCNIDELRYNLCFANTSKESVAMWAIYGGDSSIKIRLSLSRNKLIESLSNNFFYDANKHNKISISDVCNGSNDIFLKKGFSLQDVVYYDRRKNNLRYNGKPYRDLVVNGEIPLEYRGFIKYDAWEFESEVRVSVILVDRFCNRINKIYKPEYIYGNVSDELVKNFEITFNPWISQEMKNEVKKSLDRLSGVNIKYKSSLLEGEVDLKR